MPRPKLFLYHAWVSSASRKVRLCLAEKGLDYEDRVLNLAAFEHHQSWYKDLNPSGVVPALLVDGRPLVESNFINEWLDESYPAPPLRPGDPFALHDMRHWAKYIDDHCLPAIQKHNWMKSFHPMARRWSDEELARRLAAIPTAERRHIWRRMAREPFTQAELEAALDVLREMMDRIEARLSRGRHLIGDAFSLADIAATPYVARVEDLRPEELAPERRPAAARWWAAIKARPSYRAAEIRPYDEQSVPGWIPEPD